MNKMQLYEKTTKTISGKAEFIFKTVNLEWSPELDEAIEFNRMNITAKEVIISAWALGLTLLFITFIATLITHIYMEMNPLVTLLIGTTASLLVLYYISEYPKLTASMKRIKALGHAPEIVAYLIIPLKQNPNLENAVRFAAEHSEGELANDLRKSLWDVWSGKVNSIGEALPLLGDKWSKHIKGFQDSLYAIRTSQLEKSETRRLNALDRALDSILKSIQESFKEYIEYLRLPTMVIFAGGAILPLVVIIMLPLVSFMGADFGNPLNLATMLLVILALIFLYSEYTLRKRPAAFPVLNIPDKHPALPAKGKMIILGREVSILGAALWTTFLIFSLSLPYLLGIPHWLTEKLNTVPIVVGVSLGFFIYLRGKSVEKRKLRNFIQETEKETIEASFQLGNRLISGMSAEEALIRVARAIPNPASGASRIFRKAVQNIRYMNTNIEDAFFDEKIGALRESYSSLINSIFRIFVSSMEKSITTASESLITAANHIREIQKVEANLKNKITYTSSMMKITAVAVSPAICALTIYIAKVFQKTTEVTSHLSDQYLLIKQPPTSPEILQLIVGLYMIALIVVLVRYTSILENGDDTVLVQYEISRAIPIAVIIYLSVLFISNLFV